MMNGVVVAIGQVALYRARDMGPAHHFARVGSDMRRLAFRMSTASPLKNDRMDAHIAICKTSDRNLNAISV